MMTIDPVQAESVRGLPTLAPGEHPPDFVKLIGDGVKFHRLVPASDGIPAAPRFVFGPVSAPVTARMFTPDRLPANGVFRAERIELLGETLLCRDDVVYRSPNLKIHRHYIARELEAMRARGVVLRPRRLPGEHVLIGGIGLKVFGHWLIDVLPKFGVLQAAGYDIDTLSYLVPAAMRGFGREFLRLLGIRPDQLVDYDPAQESLLCDTLIIPTVLTDGARVSPMMRDATRLLLDRFAATSGPLAQPGTPARLFFSRATVSQTRRLTNRDRIEALAAAAGFTVLAPETIPLLDQLRILAGARAIMGEYGSALHASIFAPRGTVICALHGDIPHPHFVQTGLGAALEQPTGYVFGAITGRGEGPTPPHEFEVAERDFAAGLAAVESLLAT